MQPVAPSIASAFMKRSSSSLSSESRGQQESKIVPDDGGGQNQSIDAIEYATMPRQQGTRILYSGAALIGGFQQVASLPRDIGQASHQHRLKRVDIQPAE